MGTAYLNSPSCFLWFLAVSDGLILCTKWERQVFPFCFVLFSLQSCNKCITLSSRYLVHFLHYLQIWSLSAFSFWEFDSGSTSTPLWSNMSEHCTLVLTAQTSVRLTNDSPTLGKPLADGGRSESWAKPHWFPRASLPKHMALPGHDMSVGVSTPRAPSGLCFYQPAGWHRAEPKSLMNKPPEDTWKGRAIFSFDCHDPCNWQMLCGSWK